LRGSPRREVARSDLRGIRRISSASPRTTASFCRMPRVRRPAVPTLRGRR
jgi:hypothetical protein